MGWNLYFDPMVRNPSKTENKPTKNLEFQNQEEASSIQHRFINLPNLTLLEYGYDSDDSGSCSICSGNIKEFRLFRSQEFVYAVKFTT